MKTPKANLGVNLRQEIYLINELIDENCSYMASGDYWAIKECLAKLGSFLWDLPEGTQQEVLNSGQYWTDVNDYMNAWIECTSPEGGWCKGLLARLPLGPE